VNVEKRKLAEWLATAFGFILALLLMLAGVGSWRLEALRTLLHRLLNELQGR
jgi:hypothetical protein